MLHLKKIGLSLRAFLKELLEPKVRASVDGLPFTAEGYERAKNILKLKFGKTSEIVNAYVNNIITKYKWNQFVQNPRVLREACK